MLFFEFPTGAVYFASLISSIHSTTLPSSLFLNRDLRHRRAGRRAMPMLHPRCGPHDVSGPDLFDRAATACRFFAGTWLLSLTGKSWIAIAVPAILHGASHTGLDFLPPAKQGFFFFPINSSMSALGNGRGATAARGRRRQSRSESDRATRVPWGTSARLEGDGSTGRAGRLGSGEQKEKSLDPVADVLTRTQSPCRRGTPFRGRSGTRPPTPRAHRCV